MIVDSVVDDKPSRVVTEERSIVGYAGYQGLNLLQPGNEGALVYAVSGAVMGMLFARDGILDVG